jgi:phosphoribosyl 1,2-cyclic phosphodiesterase
MKVKFWGARGSLPRCHPEMVKYGGNTPCIEVTTSTGHTFILDMGSGAVDLGGDLIKRMKESNNDDTSKTGTVLITHTHWDHIQGIPFFAPFYIPGFKWELYGPK